MPGNTRKVKLASGVSVEAEIVQPMSSQETFNAYLLEDGSTVRLKAVALEFLRLPPPHFDAAGEPVYLLRSHNVVTVSAPEHLRKKT